MIKSNFYFFNAESIRGFISTFVAIYYATSYTFDFPSIIKHLPLEILKFLFTKLSNHDKEVPFIWDNEDGALSIYSGFLRTYHYMYIIVQITGRDEYTPIGKSWSPNNTLSNIKRSLLMNPGYKK